MAASRKRILTLAVSAAVAALLLWLCFRRVHWADVTAYLGACHWGWVLLSMGLGAVVFWLRALRWRMMLLPLDASTSQITCFNAINIGYLVSNALSRIGELVRCGYVVRHSSVEPATGRRRAGFDRVLGTIVADRVWDALSLLILFGVTLALMWNRYGAVITGHLFGTGSAALVWGLLLAALVLLVLACWILWRYRERSRFCGRIWGFVAGMIDGIRACLRMKGAWKFFLLTAGIWALYWAMISCIVLAFKGIDASAVLASGVEPTPIAAALSRVGAADTLLLMLVGSIVSIIPVPGAFGTYHAAIALTLAVVCCQLSGQSVTQEAIEAFAPFGVIFATLSHESQLLTQVLFGTGSLIHESLRQAPGPAED